MKEPAAPNGSTRAHEDSRGTKDTWDRIRAYGLRYKTFDWPSVKLYLNFLFTFNLLFNHFQKKLKKYGLSPATLNVLLILSRSYPEGCKQSRVSGLLFVSRANVTGLIDNLVRRGLARRQADPKDRRVWIVKITPKGQSLLSVYLPGHYREIGRLAGILGAKEKAAFDHSLEKLRSRIG